MSDRPQTTFLGCRDCGVLVPVPLAHPGEFQDDAADTLLAISEFFRGHPFHPIAQFTKCDGETVATRPLWDPMTELRFEISDGTRTFVAHCRRSAVDEPRRFEFRPGRLEIATQLGLDFGDLRRSLDLEFHPHALRPTKVDNLIRLLRERIDHLELATIDIAYDDADDPDVSIAPLPSDTLEAVIRDSAAIFDPWELDKVSRFLRDNSREDGVLALRVRRRAAN